MAVADGGEGRPYGRDRDRRESLMLLTLSLGFVARKLAVFARQLSLKLQCLKVPQPAT